MRKVEPSSASPVGAGAEAAALAEHERIFQSHTRTSDQVLMGLLAEPYGRAVGFDSDEIPATVLQSLKEFLDNLSKLQPPPERPVSQTGAK